MRVMVVGEAPPYDAVWKTLADSEDERNKEAGLQ
jgi:hypothetical protein